MRIRKILYTSKFDRSIKRLPIGLRDLVNERQEIFRTNCFEARLKTHKLSGNLKNYWSFSVTHSHRVLFAFLEGEIVVFIDVGNHSVYK